MTVLTDRHFVLSTGEPEIVLFFFLYMPWRESLCSFILFYTYITHDRQRVQTGRSV